MKIRKVLLQLEKALAEALKQCGMDKLESRNLIEEILSSVRACAMRNIATIIINTPSFSAAVRLNCLKQESPKKPRLNRQPKKVREKKH